MKQKHFIVGALTFATTAFAFASTNADRTEAALRQLSNATKNQRGGQHLLNLASLRSLRDEDLRPFFSQFTQHPDWTVQVHAVLGIAELSEEQTVDPWLVQQIAPTAREHLIAQALDDGLLKKEQMHALLKWPPLESTPRLLLLADLNAIGEEIDSDMLQELTDSTDLSVAMFASLLSKNKTNIDQTTKSLRRATNSNREDSLQRTLQLIRQYSFTEATPWLISLLEDGSVVLTPNQRYWTLFTLLTVDAETGIEIWNREFHSSPERRDQVRYLLLVLESGIAPSEEMRERLQIDLDDQLLGNMFKAGQINGLQSKSTTNEIHALSELVQQGHRGTIDWAFRLAKDTLTDSQSEQFYKALSVIPKDANSKRKEAAIHAFTQLIQVAPNTAWAILQEAKDDSEQQELLLLAMLQFSNSDAVEQASKLRRIGVNKADVLALLLVARSDSPLQQKDQECLGIIASGGGHLNPALETQAAWLYLKRMGLSDKALAAVSTQ
jgi:hypothetical protein